MEKAGKERAKGVRRSARRSQKMGRRYKKILNRRNKATDLLKGKELAFSSAKNELVFERKEAPSKRKI